jgi:hypothetical protein
MLPAHMTGLRRRLSDWLHKSTNYSVFTPLSLRRTRIFNTSSVISSESKTGV